MILRLDLLLLLDSTRMEFESGSEQAWSQAWSQAWPQAWPWAKTVAIKVQVQLFTEPRASGHERRRRPC